MPPTASSEASGAPRKNSLQETERSPSPLNLESTHKIRPDRDLSDLDTLDWPTWRKYTVFAIVCAAAFIGLASALAHSNALVVQAKIYHVTPTEMSYSISAAVAGLMAGPVLFVPLSQVIGTSSCIFWSLLGMMACGIWAAKMTASGDYISFVISRLFGGLFGSVPQILGNGVIVNLFPLQDRGKAFAIYSTVFVLGAVGGPTFDGFIIQHTKWPIEFWWTIAFQGVVLILCFFFLEETAPENRHGKSRSWVGKRFTTFFAGTRVVTKKSVSEVVGYAVAPFFIFLSPVTILAGIFDMVNYGWLVVINTLLSIFLQEPYIPSKGMFGYGFTPQQNAAFLFALWIGVLVAQAYTFFLNDRVPLLVGKRRGDWHPEYRLYTLWVPGLIIMPIGLGLFGASLQYHLHFMVLALASFLVAFAAVASVPMPINYLVESFKRNPQEVGTTLNVYRLLLGLIVPFYIMDWEMSVGVGWVFGMAAFFSIFAFLLVLLLIWKGQVIRRWSAGRVASADEGVSVLEKAENSA